MYRESFWTLKRFLSLDDEGGCKRSGVWSSPEEPRKRAEKVSESKAEGKSDDDWGRGDENEEL